VTQGTAAKLWAYFHHLSEFDKSLVVGFAETVAHKTLPKTVPEPVEKRCFLQAQDSGLAEYLARK
jgi:hypothetical protein